MPRLKTDDALMGTNAAARYLCLHRSTLTYWRRKGVLTPTAVTEGPWGPQFKFSKGDLDRFRDRIDYE
jgi:DNA-binding transcriptional MerR regulator